MFRALEYKRANLDTTWDLLNHHKQKCWDIFSSGFTVHTSTHTHTHTHTSSCLFIQLRDTAYILDGVAHISPTLESLPEETAIND